MTTFIQKLRVTILGNVHQLLDKAIDLNSPAVVRQYVRDLEDAQDKLRNEAAIQAGQLRTFKREVADMQGRVDLGKATLTKLQTTGTPALAKSKASEIVALQKSIATEQAQIPELEAAAAKLDEAVANLETRHTQMVQQLRTLERLDRDSKSKEQATRALQAAGRLVSGGADVSVDDVQSRIQARNDVASEKFDRAMGDVKLPEDDPNTAEAVEQLLNETKPQQAAKAAK